MIAVPIIDTRDLRTGPPVSLFENIRIGRAFVSADDRRFLILEKADASQSAQLRLVQNWFEELQQRLGRPK